MYRNEFVGIAKDWSDWSVETEWYNQKYENKTIEFGAPGPFQVQYLLFQIKGFAFSHLFDK